MPKLTKRVIDSLTCPEGKAQVRVYDSTMRAFGVIVSKTGRRSFFVEYTPPGGRARRRIVLGHYGQKPTETIDAARAEASRVLGQVRLGIDPLEQRRTIGEAGSFATWAETYLEHGKAAGRWVPRTLVEVERHLRRAKEAFGALPLGSVDARTIEGWRDRIHEEHGLTEANKALGTVKAAMRSAWKRGHIPTDEAAKVDRIAGELPRTRTLSEDEMKALLGAVEAHHSTQFRVALLWLAMTGARRSEVLRAKWSDLRLDPPDKAEWTIPRAKNAQPSVRPIPAELVKEIRRLPRDSVLVVGKWTDNDFAKEWQTTRDAAGLPGDIHLHDLRRTAGLWIARAAGLQTAQRLLGHADIATTARVYAPLSTDDLRGPQAEVVGKVLAFRRKASGEEEQ